MLAANLPFDLPLIGSMHSVRTPFATIVPPARRVVAILDNSGNSVTLGNLQDIPVVTTLAAALAKASSGRGDYILVMPGHSENVAVTTMLDNLVNDTHVIGVGDPACDSGPTFRWTAADANWAVHHKNCSFENLRLKFDGANNITEAISVSAAGVTFANCWMLAGSGASNDCARLFDIESGADDFRFLGNAVYQSGGTTTAVLNFGAAVARAVVVGNMMRVIGSAVGAGAISISAAITQALISNNRLANEVTNGTTCIDVADVAATGEVSHNLMRVLVSGTASGEGITLAGTTNVALGFFQNYCTDEKGKSGLLSPTAAT